MKMLTVVLALLSMTAAHAQRPEAERPNGGVVDFLQPVEPDPLVQHSKEVYVRNGCAYCHGVDLRVRNGEAADLLHSSLVAADVNGNVLGPILRHGIAQTAKMSPMPQFNDLSDRNIVDLARWIHTSRQQVRFAELTAPGQPAGTAGKGEAIYTRQCASCHSKPELTAIAHRLPADQLRPHTLRPTSLSGVQSFRIADLHDTAKNTARQAHHQMLETISNQDFADLSAWMTELR